MTRLAGSIQTLTDDVHKRSPLTTIFHYDNDAARNSDHDPNDFDVVCACDIMQGHGLDLHDLSREIVAARHPECAYVIFNRQIASRNTGWKWVDYYGESDHTDHIHVSVGTGKDGYKRPPYDSTRHWLEENDMTPEEHSWLQNLSNGFWYGGPSAGLAVDPENVVNGTLSGGDPKNPLVQVADKYRNGVFSQLKQIRANQQKILEALKAEGDCAITPEQLETLAQDVATRLNTLTFLAHP